MIDHRPPTIVVHKPWGRFEQYTHNLFSTVKVITVAPGGMLSRQYHYKRDELWIILDAGVRVELGEKILEPTRGERIFVPRGTEHRLSSTISSREIRILKVSFGEFDEDDIVRLEDAYDRVEPEDNPSLDHSIGRDVRDDTGRSSV